jgi:hypothetical protein
VTKIVVTEGRHSVYFDGAEWVLRAAMRRVRCSYQLDRRTKRLSVPKQFGDRVIAAIESGRPSVGVERG